MSEPSNPKRRFAVAISYPGKQRDLVAPVAEHLAEALGRRRVLFAPFHESELARAGSGEELPALYLHDSELIAVVLCPEYTESEWCMHEWESIRQLRDANQGHRIIYLSAGAPGDRSKLGIPEKDIYLDISRMKPYEAGEVILNSVYPPADRGIDISRIDRYAPDELIGRDAELAVLDDAWERTRRLAPGRPRVLTFVALGGEGKTSLVAKWLAECANRNWPGCDGAFAWSFYSQGSRDQAAVSSDLFFSEALRFFGDPELANSAASAFDKARKLATLVRDRRHLLVLDGLEPLQYPPGPPFDGELKDKALAELLKQLAASGRSLCLVTTRYSVPDLRTYRRSSAPEIPLLRLSAEGGVALLKHTGVKGRLPDMTRLVEDVNGHALTVNLLGTFLRDAYGGDVRCRDRIDFSDLKFSKQGAHAFHVMEAYMRWLQGSLPKRWYEKLGLGKRRNPPTAGATAVDLLRLLGLFDRPADIECIEALLKPPAIANLTEGLAGLDEPAMNQALTVLEAARLVTAHRHGSRVSSVDAHPLVREYFASVLHETVPAAWRGGHRRLYEFLTETTVDKPEPTLEELQPLYQAVNHGCLAGKFQEACVNVYHNRILRGDEFYSTVKLGAFGADLAAVANFFLSPWNAVQPALTIFDQAWLFNQAAFYLRALGRLQEATKPMRDGLRMRVAQKDWIDAARAAGNLSGLELALGDIDKAVQDATQALRFADDSKDEFQRLSKRAAAADALHQAGQNSEARQRFEEAETMQSRRQPEYPLLYSLAGYRYCEFIARQSEINTWKRLLDHKVNVEQEALDTCEEIAARAAKTLQWMIDNRMALLDIALGRLTLAKAALYRAILTEQNPQGSAQQMQAAVDGLRKAGQSDDLPRGLLARAFQRAAAGDYPAAQEDLDEAWEIAERGPMPLHMADIHLHRCRLFHAVTPYPWEGGPKHDLAEARRLVEKHGYWRRKEELEDAEAAAVNW